MKNVVIEQTDPPVESNILASAIVKISESADALRKSGLNEEVIIVLLCDRTKYSKTVCRDVLRGLAQLRSSYTSLK